MNLFEGYFLRHSYLNLISSDRKRTGVGWLSRTDDRD